MYIDQDDPKMGAYCNTHALPHPRENDETDGKLSHFIVKNGLLTNVTLMRTGNKLRLNFVRTKTETRPSNEEVRCGDTNFTKDDEN